MREKYGSREGEDRFVCLRRPSDAQGHGLSPPPSSMLCLDGAFYPSPPSLPSSTLPSAHASSSYHHTPPPCQPSRPPCSPSIIDAIYAAFGKYCSMNGAASPWIEGDGVLFFFFFFFLLLWILVSPRDCWLIYYDERRASVTRKATKSTRSIISRIISDLEDQNENSVENSIFEIE